MQKKGFVLFRPVRPKGSVENQFVELVSKNCGIVVTVAVFEPVDGFFLKGFELGGGDASLGSKKKGSVFFGEAVVDSRRLPEGFRCLGR